QVQLGEEFLLSEGGAPVRQAQLVAVRRREIIEQNGRARALERRSHQSADRLEDLREACTPAACVELHGVVRRKRVQLGMQQQEVRIETVQRRVGVEQFLHRLSERGRMTGGDQAAASEIRLDELGQLLEYDRACERDTRLSPSVRSAQRSTHTAHVDTVERQRIRRAQLLEQIAHRAWSNLVD